MIEKVPPIRLKDASAIHVAEAIRKLRLHEAEYRRLNELRGREGTRFLIRQNAMKVRDASIEVQVASICYEFTRHALRHVQSNHRIALPHLERIKVDKGWTAEDLSERLGIPEATIICIEDCWPVSPLVGARLAHALGVELAELVLGEGETASSYWRFAR